MRHLTPPATSLTWLILLAGPAIAQRPDAPQQRPAHPILRLFDTNGDRSLSAREMEDAVAKLKQLDASGDGELTSEELFRALPMGRGPRGGAGPPQQRGRARLMSSELEKEPLAQDDAEQRILSTLEEMWQGERFRNVSPTDGRLLRLLAESIGAQRVVEIGTSTGESALWLALALQSTGGQLFTHEIDAGRAEIARQNFQKAGVDDIVTLIPGDAHETVKQHTDTMDILFLDADKEGYIDYLDQLWPLLRPGGLVIAHNMNTRQADPQYVKAITENPALETLILLKEGTGVGVTLKKR